jgi:pimeloyl-ACP methyl ester carboxylesterase
MIYGSYDKTSSEKHVTGTKARFLPQLEIVRLENIGHWVMVEAAEQVTKTVIEFIERGITGQRAKL